MLEFTMLIQRTTPACRAHSNKNTRAKAFMTVFGVDPMQNDRTSEVLYIGRQVAIFGQY